MRIFTGRLPLAMGLLLALSLAGQWGLLSTHASTADHLTAIAAGASLEEAHADCPLCRGLAQVRTLLARDPSCGNGTRRFVTPLARAGSSGQTASAFLDADRARAPPRLA
jgi:hypothetical protein